MSRSPTSAIVRPGASQRRAKLGRRRAARRVRSTCTSPRQLQLALTPAAAALDECAFCRDHLGERCGRCATLAVRVHDLVAGAHPVSVAAATLGLTEQFAAELLAEEQDRRALAGTRVAKVANAGLRAHCIRLAAADPRLYVRIAERGGWKSPSDVRRLLGLQETSAKTVAGRRYPGTTLSHISTQAAGRLARALGYLPLDVDWPEAARFARAIC
jgi:hypothetical protein